MPQLTTVNKHKQLSVSSPLATTYKAFFVISSISQLSFFLVLSPSLWSLSQMSSFASLMALSATYTQASQDQAQAKLAERTRREAEAKKRQLEQEKKDREREAQMRLKHFEQQKKDEERKKRKEEERKAIEAAVERRKAAERDALLHGPAKKSSSHRTSSASQVRRRAPANDADDDDGPKSEPLTREELRERKLQAELRRQFTSAKRSTTTGGYHRHGKHLPGGAVDITTTGLPSTGSSSGSVKARLAAIPNTLTKLNTVKRDTRTIDEILQDRAKAKEQKILDGQDALAFDDWFGTKKKEKSRPSSLGPASGENTPKSAASASRSTGTPPIQSTKKVKPTPSSRPLLKPSTSKLNPRPSEKSEKYSPPKLSRPNARPSGSVPKKRTRSLSRSESPHPKRRAISSEHLDDEVDAEALDVSGLIWGIMGKNRNHYVNMDVFSDDEDMEVDASALEREEKRSARIARQEELAALEAEKRHEEEKRRRKMRA
ncbi:hypothetical protein J3R30DRAFT_3469785 [Lentinula aciculospora]|uniref:SPT2-domain-containing protein n=1 Tax=Lentinula aciculospora TaxID=153920 RepID=A0A9W9AE75_9AGAR|nr:hypothetical protein J3R30DRAFT_3469785 [Lentinula aciculospora]